MSSKVKLMTKKALPGDTLDYHKKQQYNNKKGNKTTLLAIKARTCF